MAAEPALLPAAAYLRKSPGSSTAKTEISLEIQLEHALKRAAADGFEIVRVFRDVWPRWELWERPDMREMRACFDQEPAERGWGRVYVWDTSRLAMGIQHQAIVLEHADRRGVEVCFINEQIDRSTEIGELAWLIKGSFDKFEVARIRDRTMGGKQKRLAQGKLPGYARAPLGYRFPDGTRDRLEADPATVAPARRIFRELVAGSTAGQLAVAFTEEGIPTPGGAATWNPKTIAGIVRNPTYKGEPAVWKTRGYRQDGKMRHAKRDPAEWQTMPPGTAPALVSADVWQQANDRLDANRRKTAPLTGQTTHHLLRGGLVVCAGCDQPMGLHTARRKGDAGVVYRSYVCRSLLGDQVARATGSRPACDEPARIRSEQVDEDVWRWARSRLENPGATERADAKDAQRRAQAEVKAAEKAVRVQQGAVDRATEELVMTEDADARASLRARRDTLTSLLREARRRLDAARRAVGDASDRAENLRALHETVLEHQLALEGLVPGRLTPTEVDVVRGILQALGVRARVWRAGAAAAPPGRVSVDKGSTTGSTAELNRLLARLRPGGRGGLPAVARDA